MRLQVLRRWESRANDGGCIAGGVTSQRLFAAVGCPHSGRAHVSSVFTHWFLFFYDIFTPCCMPFNVQILPQPLAVNSAKLAGALLL